MKEKLEFYFKITSRGQKYGAFLFNSKKNFHWLFCTDNVDYGGGLQNIICIASQERE